MKAIFCYNNLLLDGWGPEFGAASLEWQKVVRNQKQPWSAPSCWDPGSSVFLALMEWLSLEEYFSFKQRKWFSYNISIKNSTVYLISFGACVPFFGAFSFLSFFFFFFLVLSRLSQSGTCLVSTLLPLFSVFAQMTFPHENKKKGLISVCLWVIFKHTQGL